MWPFKKKIKETPKGRLYGNRYNSDKNFSVWDGMSIIEQFSLVLMPCMLVFIIYMMCDLISPEMFWWVRVLIGIGVTAALITMITFIVEWCMERWG